MSCFRIFLDSLVYFFRSHGITSLVECFNRNDIMRQTNCKLKVICKPCRQRSQNATYVVEQVCLIFYYDKKNVPYFVTALLHVFIGSVEAFILVVWRGVYIAWICLYSMIVCIQRKKHV